MTSAATSATRSRWTRPSIGAVLVEIAGAILGVAASLAAALVGLVAFAHAELIPGKPPR